MIIVTASFFFKENKLSEALVALDELVAKTRQEKGCIEYTAYKSKNNSTEIIIIEKWESQAHLDAHNQTPHFKNILPILIEGSAQSPIVKTFVAIDAI